MIDVKRSTPWAVRSLIAPVILVIIAITVYLLAQGYDDVARRFPSMVAVALFVLACIDGYSRTNLKGTQFLAASMGTDFENSEMQHAPSFWSEVTMILWVVGCVISMVVIGILPTLPIFTAAFIWLRAGLTPLQALIAAAVVLIFVFGVFEFTLGSQVYRGLLFTKHGW